MIRLRRRVIVNQQITGREVQDWNLLGTEVALDLTVETVVHLPGAKSQPLEGVIGPLRTRRLVFGAPEIETFFRREGRNLIALRLGRLGQLLGPLALPARVQVFEGPVIILWLRRSDDHIAMTAR